MDNKNFTDRMSAIVEKMDELAREGRAAGIGGASSSQFSTARWNACNVWNETHANECLKDIRDFSKDSSELLSMRWKRVATAMSNAGFAGNYDEAKSYVPCRDAMEIEYRKRGALII